MAAKKRKLELEELELYKVELGKLLEGQLSLHNLRVQLGGIFATLILAVLGVAFNSQKAGLFFIAGGIQWGFIYLDRLIRVVVSFYYLRLAQLQKQLMPNDPDAFVGAFYSFGSRFQKQILDLINVTDVEERNKILKSNIGLGYRSFVGFWLPLISSIFDIGLGLYMYAIGGWSIF